MKFETLSFFFKKKDHNHRYFGGKRRAIKITIDSLSRAADMTGSLVGPFSFYLAFLRPCGPDDQICLEKTSIAIAFAAMGMGYLDTFIKLGLLYPKVKGDNRFDKPHKFWKIAVGIFGMHAFFLDLIIFINRQLESHFSGEGHVKRHPAVFVMQVAGSVIAAILTHSEVDQFIVTNIFNKIRCAGHHRDLCDKLTNSFVRSIGAFALARGILLTITEFASVVSKEDYMNSAGIGIAQWVVPTIFALIQGILGFKFSLEETKDSHALNAYIFTIKMISSIAFAFKLFGALYNLENFYFDFDLGLTGGLLLCVLLIAGLEIKLLDNPNVARQMNLRHAVNAETYDEEATALLSPPIRGKQNRYGSQQLAPISKTAKHLPNQGFFKQPSAAQEIRHPKHSTKNADTNIQAQSQPQKFDHATAKPTELLTYLGINNSP